MLDTFTKLAIARLPKLALAEVIFPDAVSVTVDTKLAPVISPLGPVVDKLPNTPLLAVILPVALRVVTFAVPTTVNRLVVLSNVKLALPSNSLILLN